MNKGFQYNMATGRAVLPAAVIVSLALWALHYRSHYYIIGAIVCMLSSYLLIGLNSTFGIIRTRSYLPSALFMFMYSACIFLFDYHNIAESIIPLLFIGSIFFIIKGYESENHPADVFNAFIFASMGCIANRNLLAIIPVLFICMFQLRSMTSRGLPAAILGFGVPYWMITGYFFMTDHTDKLKSVMQKLFSIDFFNFGDTDIQQWIFIGITFLVFVSTAIPAGRLSLKDKVKNRSMIKALNTLCIYMFLALIIVPSTGITLLPMIMIVTSLIFSYVMTQIYNRLTLILLVSTILIVSAIAVYGLML